MIIAKSKGIKINNYYIPPFQINQGELIGLYLLGGGRFVTLKEKMIRLLTGIEQHSNLTITHPLHYVIPIHNSSFYSYCCPMTIEKYQRKNGKSGSKELDRIFKIDYIKPQTRINALAGNPRKWLSLFTSFSKFDKIIFDLVGQDPIGVEQTLDYVQDFVNRGGTAILLDNFDDSEDRCMRYYKIGIISEK